jgi:putative peptidoglycan lipid II flippase
MVRLAGLGHAGLALSTSLVAIFGASVLFEVIRRRIGGVQGRRLARSFFSIAAASAMMGVACALSSHAILRWLGVSRLARVIDLAISVPIGLAVFYIVCKAFKLAELESARRALVIPIARRLGFQRVKI